MASDIYKPLMDIWHLIQTNPDIILSTYREQYRQLKERGVDYYDEVVRTFNRQPDDGKDPLLFHFITKTCMRGSIEFDRFGDFITKFQAGGDISSPESLKPIFERWNAAIQPVQFSCESYTKILDHGVEKGDYCFFDPPYIDGTWYRDNNIDMKVFYEFLRMLPCDYSITLNGDKDMYPIPEDLYTMHEYIYYGISKSKSGRPTGSRDSLWMNHKTGEYNRDIRNVRDNARTVGGMIPMNTELSTMAEINNRLNVIEQILNKMGTSINTLVERYNEQEGEL